MTHKTLRALALLLSVQCLCSCGSPNFITLRYRQSANLESFAIPQSCPDAIRINHGSNQVTGGFWILYEVTAITNTPNPHASERPLPFNFLPERAYVQTGFETYNPGFAVPCLQTAQNVTVAPGSSVGYVGRLLINVESAIGDPRKHNAQFNLLYAPVAGLTVDTFRDPGIRPTAPAFADQPPTMPLFLPNATDDQMSQILTCTAQSTPPPNCTLE